MKKYKFRGKRADNGKWVYGDLLYIAGGCMIYFGSSTDTVEPDIENTSPVAVELFNEEVAVVDPATVGQFTSMADCDKTDIYEGDILIEPSVATIPLEVRYNETQCAFCLIEHTHTEGPLLGTCPLGDMLRHYPTMKVVGNIHDNPEILSKWVQGSLNSPIDKP